MSPVRTMLGMLVVAISLAPGAASAQDLADLDYTYLSFRGFGLDG
jgi:hypothetical protein